MNWEQFLEYNKIMLVFASGIAIGTFISSYIWLKILYSREEKINYNDYENK
jgi:hypothetical protein